MRTTMLFDNVITYVSMMRNNFLDDEFYSGKISPKNMLFNVTPMRIYIFIHYM